MFPGHSCVSLLDTQQQYYYEYGIETVDRVNVGQHSNKQHNRDVNGEVHRTCVTRPLPAALAIENLWLEESGGATRLRALFRCIVVTGERALRPAPATSGWRLLSIKPTGRCRAFLRRSSVCAISP